MGKLYLGATVSTDGATRLHQLSHECVLHKLPGGGYWFENAYLGHDLVINPAHFLVESVSCLLEHPSHEASDARMIRVRKFAIRQVINNLSLASLHELLADKQVQEDRLAARTIKEKAMSIVQQTSIAQQAARIAKLTPALQKIADDAVPATQNFSRSDMHRIAAQALELD